MERVAFYFPSPCGKGKRLMYQQPVVGGADEATDDGG